MLRRENPSHFRHVSPQAEAFTEHQISAAKKRLFNLTLNEAFGHWLPESA
jgi:hypothetical protein